MKRLDVTAQLIDWFKQSPDTLIFEGYCAYSDNIIVYNDGDNYALVAKVKGVNKCCFKTCCADFVLDVIATLSGRVELCGVDPFVTDCVKHHYALLWENNCDLYAWNGKPLSYQCKQKIEPISAKYAQIISDGTHYHAPIDEVAECLSRHPSAAVYIEGKPVCWCLLHLEKSLGMLYTLPEHRHKGYALEVMTALCNEVIALGDTPYAYILCDNIASKNLASKYNLQYVKRADYFEIDFDKAQRNSLQ